MSRSETLTWSTVAAGLRGPVHQRDTKQKETPSTRRSESPTTPSNPQTTPKAMTSLGLARNG
jgi:hypothetical protein